MRHLVGGYKLRRNASHRKSLLRNLATSLIEKNRIETTLAKAKAIKPLIDKMVTLGKSGTLAARRQAVAYLYKREAVRTLFNEVAPRFMDRSGGYTRIIKTEARKGDGAEMAILEFSDHIFEVKDKKGKEKKAKAKK